MTNTEHLDWIYQRLVKVYHEDENMDYMQRLKKIIEETGEAEERADYLLGQCETVNNTNHELRARVKQLESLLGRIHKATDQFYKKQAEGHCKKADNCPYNDILDLYHKILPELPKVVKLTDKRKAAMRQRWQSDLETRTDWALYFKDAASKPFFFGRNDRGWIADFDFFLREQTITYIQEGKYG